MDVPGWGRVSVSRRKLVVSAGAVAVAGAVAADQADKTTEQLLETIADSWGPVNIERIRRGADHLVVNLVLGNLLRVKTRNGTVVRPRTPRSTGYLALVLPGQSVGEHIPLFDVDGFLPYPAMPVRAELALPTVLTFLIEPGRSIPYTLSGLLSLTELAAYDKFSAPRRGVPITAIEAPYRMMLVPDEFTRWWTARVPKKLKTDGGPATTEIWHTRLIAPAEGTSKLDFRGTRRKRVAISAPRKEGFDKNDPFRAPLSLADREEIYGQASTFDVKYSGGKVVTAPVSAPEILLTSLGATLELHGSWPGANNITTWDHRATLGRDNYVRVVKEGWLAPYRHRACVIEETFRLMRSVDPWRPSPEAAVTIPGHTEAVLIKLSTLIVRDPIADTDLAGARLDNGVRKGLPFPFTQVECTSLVSTSLVSTTEHDIGDINGPGGVPHVLTHGSAAPLRLKFVGVDHNGRQIPFTSAVWFVPGKLPDAAKAKSWNDDTKVPDDVRRASVANLEVAIAPEADGHPGLTTLPLVGLTVSVQDEPDETPPWRPVADVLDAASPGISAFAGPGAAIPHAYHGAYRSNEANPGGVVLSATSESVPGKTTGGLVPMPSYQGLSRTAGSVMGAVPEAMADLGAGDASALLTSLFQDVKLLGVLPLVDILAGLGSFRSGSARAIDDVLPQIPGVTHEVRDGRVYVDLDLALPMKGFFDGFDNPVLKFRSMGDDLEIKAHAEAGAGGPAETNIDAQLRNIALEFAGVVALPIRDLRAHWDSSGSKSFHFEISNVQFLGPLAFLQPLSNFMNLGAVEDDLGNTRWLPSRAAHDRTGTAVARVAGTDLVEGVDAFVDDMGLHLLAGYTLPDIPLGVFTLSGMNFGLEVAVPFDGGILIHGWFASYEAPFTATFSGFGGTGYVDLEVSDKGLERVTASIGIAASVGIDLVVASAVLSVNVGFVMTLDADDGIELQAYFRISGSVNILGLAAVTVVFELSLAFHDGGSGPSKLTGTARFLIKVDTVIVDKEVEARISRTFAGGKKGKELNGSSDPFEQQKGRPALRRVGADNTLPPDDLETPIFRTTHTAATWQRYAAAFAPA